MRPSLTVVGSINLDLVARTPRFPRPGETVSQAEFEMHPGGKGANQALGAALLGAEVRMIGSVGHAQGGRGDYFADEALALLAGHVALEIQYAAAPTGVAFILVNDDGENQIIVAPGANLALDTIYVRDRIGDAPAVLCQLEIPAVTVAAAAQAAKGFFCLNAAPAYPVLDQVLRRADLIVVNEHELEALPVLARAGLLAVTYGERGAVLLEAGEEVARAEPPHVEVVDTTGAGDAFTACLVVSHLEGREWDEALSRACAAGAIAASRFGAQPSLPTAKEVDEILAP